MDEEIRSHMSHTPRNRFYSSNVLLEEASAEESQDKSTFHRGSQVDIDYENWSRKKLKINTQRKFFKSNL
jgi:hypothetical protein